MQLGSMRHNTFGPPVACTGARASVQDGVEQAFGCNACFEPLPCNGRAIAIVCGHRASWHAGWLGVKTGRGVFIYPDGKHTSAVMPGVSPPGL